MNEREPLARVAKAIHTLFYATERAGERYRALEASIESDDELAAFQALSVGLINFDPLSPEKLAALQAVVADLDRAEAERPKEPSARITIRSHESDDGRYIKRLLETMYTRWQGTLDYERGSHRFCFFSPFDEQGRRVTVFANVAVDGIASEVRARSYILGPYLRVSDERTKRESDDPWRVLGGDLTPILPAEEPSA